ncbi:MAG: Alpha/beta hydrolase fold protein [Candidatus Wolfebacteria bacterium GW2011_GWE1_48_7]|uniref:Alpha/beta hydrolase fold protein n=2 Tax=Candidatus Wolfeibacteriota TaxID=1752735 RepID=A0A0G1U7H3_9BACT|nr:MAG: hypothetical protein UX70_C0001G0658 [Candidatus Wolfebacteria bacterium GW2011_GWB1_47_1]KKU34750.1 MAG: Alpha/beta hydrolase fold protein [Candidatus Wolfebacteria bacterium GW2011_GWC2_46_275]KKU42418.1 MAG: Alpha/beta hydrolase fold protein [Candidatus Wolfebacteria bacterium GW2011_GWB2_46_69]KKU54202.1 MAG: Alpha/beta hydrolase fold protein [Candidatus Wolfebacteria bacterium GW2011_GWC1_47_103]KKU58706.1 MAG: Alpha/beta hydrolase fold protein [Candidatus Wolfebacteria bacterium G
MELLHLTTSDVVKLTANYFPVDRKKYPNPKGWVVFLHMMPATKESWNVLADQLQQYGYAGIAIDLRGHGSSDGGPQGFMEFSDAEHQDSVRDIDAAIDLLTAIGARRERIILIGASIGANLALQYVVRHRDLKKCVLLSPGLDYHGILAKPLIEALTEDKQLLIIGSHDDDRVIDNAADITTLWGSIPHGVIAQKELVETGGHGSTILTHHPELIETIITFITS